MCSLHTLRLVGYAKCGHISTMKLKPRLKYMCLKYRKNTLLKFTWVVAIILCHVKPQFIYFQGAHSMK